MTYSNPEPKGLSITSAVLGIASLFFGWTFLVPIIGLIVGFMGLKREPAGKGFAITGLVLNGLCMLGWLIGLIVLALLGASIFALAGLS